MILGATKQGIKRVIPELKRSIEYANKKLQEKLSQEEIDFWMKFRENEIMILNWLQIELENLLKPKIKGICQKRK